MRNCRWTIVPRQSFWISLYIASKWEKLSSFSAFIYQVNISMYLLSGCAEHKHYVVCGNATQAQQFSLTANKLSQENVTNVYWTLNTFTVSQKAVKYLSHWTILWTELFHVYILNAWKSPVTALVLQFCVRSYWRTFLWKGYFILDNLTYLTFRWPTSW